MNSKKADRGVLLSLILAGVSILSAVGLSIWLARSIARPIAELRAIADRISMSDLSATIDIDRKDEIGDLATAFQRMVVAVRFFAAEAQEIDEQAEETRSRRTSV